jgi:hypothetical protein
MVYVYGLSCMMCMLLVDSRVDDIVYVVINIMYVSI